MNDIFHGINESTARLESSMTKFKNDIIEWMFLLWIAQVVLYAFILMLLYATK